MSMKFIPPYNAIHVAFNKFVLVFALFFYLHSVNGQNKSVYKDNNVVYSEDFVHNAMHFFKWKDLEMALAAKLAISEEQSVGFINYLQRIGKLDQATYLRKVKEGSINSANAIQYWLDQLPHYEAIYKQNLSEFLKQQESANQVFKPYTGGAICNNLDFSDGTTNGWKGSWNDNMQTDPNNNNYGLINNNTINSSGGYNSLNFVHELFNAGTDPAVPSINTVPPGHTYSIRLGNSVANSFYNHQTLTNTFNVTKQNNTLVYWYAVVFNQTGNHQQSEQPFFKIRMYDKDNNEIQCAHYDVDASTGTSGGFTEATIASGNGAGTTAVYKNWTQVMIPLVNYEGQNVTIKFETSDCNAGGHFGYAYLAVDCMPFQVLTATPFTCITPTATLSAPAGAGSYTWTGPGIVSGGTTNQIVVNAPGSYGVTMTTLGNSAGANCTFKLDTVITKNVVYPVANFNTNTPCVGANAVFSDLSSSPSGIASWNWSFGDPSASSSTTASPVFNYAAANTYNVTLIVKDNNGCPDTVKKTIVINPKPIPNFSTTSPCIGSSTGFTDLSSSNAAITNWHWDFGEVGTSAVTNPTHTYANVGTYTATLVVKDGNGCVDTVKKTTVVNPKPIAGYTANAVCLGTAMNFVNSSTPVNSSYSWTFGNNQSSNLVNPTNNYVQAGTYNTKLVVINSFGCKDSMQLPVTVHPIPAPKFTAAGVCEGLPSVFTNLTPSSPSIATWSWDFTSDGPVDNITQFPTNIYTAGTYTATLNVTTNTIPACSGTYTTTVVVSPNPVPNFSSSIVCQGMPSQFNNSASTIAAPDNIAKYNWSFGDNKTFVGSNPSHTYDTCGTYNATLVLVSNNNCTKTINRQVIVNCKPQIAFNAPDVCLKVPTPFTNTCAISTGTITGWAWDFNGDNVVDNSTMAPTNIFSAAGTYAVKLTASSDSGCVNSKIIPVTVFPLPVAKFSYSHTCFGAPTTLTDHSTVSSGQVSTWNWDFDNNQTTDNTLTSPVFTFPKVGKDSVHLTIYSDRLCKDDTIIPIYINPNPVPTVTVDDPIGCPVHHSNLFGGVLPSSVDHPNSIVKWEWDIDNNGGLDFLHNYIPGKSKDSVGYDYTNNQYDVSAVYQVHLTITSDSGCVGSYLTPAPFITVYPHPLPGFTWGPTDPLPDVYAPTVYFYNHALGATAMGWNFGDSFVKDPGKNFSIAFNPSHDYENINGMTYYVTQTVANNYGCKDSVTHPVEILPSWTFYIPNAFTPNGDGHNDGFRGTGININSYNLWIFDRWGNMIFYTRDLEEYWDGTVQGHDEIVLEDVYVWKVKFKDIFGQKHEQNGTVTVVK